MMRTYRYIKGILFAWLALVLFACSDDEYVVPGGGSEVSVSFRPTIEETLHSRGIGDASGINRITAVVFEKSGNAYVEKFRIGEDWQIASSRGLDFSLIVGRTYTVLFWAHYSDGVAGSAYTLGSDGVLSVDYSNYADRGFSGMEELDAFYAAYDITVESQVSQSRTVQLSRALAQLNFADEVSPIQGEHKAVVTFRNCPTQLNLLTGEIAATSAGDISFTFTDFPTETLHAMDKDFHYVACNYLLAPRDGSQPVNATIELQDIDGKTINCHEFKDSEAILLKRNQKNNMLGAIVQKSASIFDGTIPEISPLTTDEQNRYIIDEAADIAWLSVEANASTLEPNRTFIMTIDVDMDSHPINPVNLPEGSVLEGNDHIIKNLNLTGGLLGDATDLTVKDLSVETVSVSATATHVGALVNTLRGSGSFSNIKISGASVTTQNGAAGGMVGYIVRKNVTDRTESLNVVFDNCTLDNISISGTQGEGRFAGLLSGYDLNERVEFHGNCSTTATGTLDSYYINANKSQWQSADFTQFDGWLGKEVYRRGTVIYGTERIIPKWDGATKIVPLKDGSNTLIYSAFDLASLQGGSAGSVTFMSDIDMGGDSANAKNLYEPISTLSYLYGNNKTIYNVYIKTTFDDSNWYGGAFVRMCRGGRFENITFKNPHVEVSQIDGNAYAAIVCATAEGTMYLLNVNVEGGYLKGVNKMGGIVGYIAGTKLIATDCSVSGLEIVSDKKQYADKNLLFSIFGIKTNGEIGGMFGFLAAHAEISGCSVKNTSLDCIGCENGSIGLFTKQKYAGRHVNVFIGDIRTTNGQTIDIQYNSADFSGNIYKNRKDEYSQCKLIGHLYYTDISYLGYEIKDTKGTVRVSVDGSVYTSLTVPNGY